MNAFELLKVVEACDSIAADAEQDISDFEGKPFTGRNVSVLFGYQAAQIAALAKIVRRLAEDQLVPAGSGETR